MIIVAAGIGTFAFRLSFIQLFGWLEELPPRLERTLRLVPAAVFAAFVTPALVYVDGGLVLTPGNEKLIAGACAGIVAWRTEDMLLTIIAGMGVLWLLGAILP